MDTETQTQLEAFHRFVDEQLRNGGRNLSPEECLELWRAQHPTPEALEESLRAVQQSLADMEAGDKGRPLDEVVDEIRRKHNLPQGTLPPQDV